jgi:hypothetical protein
MSNEWKQIGTVLKSKDPSKGNYIKIKENVSLTAGDIVQIRDPRQSLESAVEAGRMSRDKADSILAKIPDFVLKELVLAPKK